MKAIRFLAAATLAVLLVGCAAAPGFMGKTGSVFLNLDNVQARSILPPISMEVTEYLVSGTGPVGSTFGPEVFTASTTIEDLLPGLWTFNVVGRNSAHNDIGEGSGGATVVIGQIAQCSITVVEYTSPDGSFLLDLAWEPDIVLDPVWTGSLKNFAAVETEMDFTVNDVACTAQSLVDPLSVGWYTMIVKLFDSPSGDPEVDGILSTGAAAAVRIAAGRQTHGDLFLHAVQGFGSVELLLDLDFADPLILTPNVPFGAVDLYTGVDQLFSVTADETCTSVFYLRGEQVATETYTVDPDGLLLGEEYRLDVVAFNTDGSRAASGTWLITNTGAMPYSENELTVTWTGVAGHDYSVYWEKSGGGSGSQNITGVAGTNTYLVEFPSEGLYKVRIYDFTTDELEWWEESNEAGADWITMPASGAPMTLDFGTLDY